MKLSLRSFTSILTQYIPQFGGIAVIDLGSSSVKIGLLKEKEWEVLEIPSLSVETRTGDIIAVGETARDMIGKLSQDMIIVHPIQGGEIGEKKSTEWIIKHGIKALLSKRKTPTRFHFFRKVILLLPAQVSRVQLRIAQHIASTIAAMEMSWIPIPVAQGWGIQALHAKKHSAVLIDIGGSTTEIAVIAQHTVLHSQSIPIGGDNFTQAIHRYCRKELGIELGHTQAESVKKHLHFFSNHLPEDPPSENKKKKRPEKPSKELIIQVKGRVVQTGLPTTRTLKQSQLLPVLDRVATELLTSIHQVLTDIPPEMGEEVVRAGLVLVGGGSLSTGLAELFHQRLGVPVHSESKNIFSAIDGVPRLLVSETTVEQKF